MPFGLDAQSLIVWLVIGVIVGWLAGQLMASGGLGMIGNIIVGVVGAVIAGWLLQYFGISFFGSIPYVPAVINALIGSIILLLVLGLLRRA